MSVSGMITLPVSSSVYQSMVANIQQIHTNGDGTLCITPMQVQKPSHQNSIGHSANNQSITTSTSNGSNKTLSSISNSSLNNSFSSIGSLSNSMLTNCHPNNHFTVPNAVPPILHNNNENHVGNNTLHDLCRVFNQTTHSNPSNGIAFNTVQPSLANVNDKKLIKCRKSPNATQLFNAPGYTSNSPQSYNSNIALNSVHLNQRSFDVENASITRNPDDSDSNNNVNGNHTGHEIKFTQLSSSLLPLTAAPTTSDPKPFKPNLFHSSTDATQSHEGEAKTIKMECELDAT